MQSQAAILDFSDMVPWLFAINQGLWFADFKAFSAENTLTFAEIKQRIFEPVMGDNFCWADRKAIMAAGAGVKELFAFQGPGRTNFRLTSPE